MPSNPLPQTNGTFVHFERMVDRARGSLLRQENEIAASSHLPSLQSPECPGTAGPAPKETEQVIRDLRLACMDVLHLVPMSLGMMVPGLEQALIRMAHSMKTQTLDEVAGLRETGPDNI